MEALLELQGVRKNFGGLVATDNVTLHVAPGEVVALIGPNGAGKTTLFNLIAGRLTPDGGKIIFANQDVTRQPVYALVPKGMGRAFQVASLFRSLPVLTNVWLAVMVRRKQAFSLLKPFESLREARVRAEEILGLVGLKEKGHLTAGVLSHGDQKRLDLAIALACRPSLLLLDEPTAGMAVGERFEFVRLVSDLVKRLSLTVLFTEHDLDVVFSIAQRIIVLHQGRIIAQGTPEQVRAHPEVRSAYLGE